MEPVAIWVEEFKKLNDGIRARIELQQKNGQAALVFVAGIITFLASSASSSKEKFSELAEQPIVLLFPLVSVVVSIFVLRHLNHDLGIIDRVSYIESVIRPKLVLAVADPDILGFESYMVQRRQSSVGRIRLLGSEHVILLALDILFLMVATWIYIEYDIFASVSVLYWVLLILGALSLVVTVIFSVKVALQYVLANSTQVRSSVGRLGSGAVAAGPPSPVIDPKVRWRRRRKV
jgi:hypothetical protein